MTGKPTVGARRKADRTATRADSGARAWQRMLSGRRLDLLDPSPLDIEIDDIAQGLSRVARWNGQTEGEWAFTVAQHSLLVEDLAGRLRPDIAERWRLAALLHDAAEYVVGDLISPFKAAVGADYKSFEVRLASAIHVRFGLPTSLPGTLTELIKRADRAAAFLEATQLAGFDETEGRRYFGQLRGAAAEPIRKLRLKPLPPSEAKAAFLARFETLSRAI